MKYSIVSGCLASLLIAVVVVQASYYGPRHSNYNNNIHHRGNYGRHHGSTVTGGRYSGVGLAHGCSGYNCNHGPNRNLSPYGPYHSYAVRPAVYGGHGLYRYRGYARHPAANSHSLYRQVRSCTGYNCNRGSHGSNYSQLNYNLRPINALVVNPVYRPISHYPYTHSGSASGYGRGPHSSSYSQGAYHGARYARRQPVSAGY